MKKTIFFTFLYLLSNSLFSQAFVTTWYTPKSILDTTSYIVFPGEGTGYLIYWEEIGNSSYNGTLIGTNTTNIYFGKKGSFRVKISGGSPAFNRINFFGNDTSAYALTSVEDWGSIQWGSMTGAFAYCINLYSLPVTAPNLSFVTDLSFMLYNCYNFNSDISNWNTSGIYNMSHLFDGCKKFDFPLNNWNVNNVVDMSFLFSSNKAVNTNLNNWNISNVTNMSYMFGGVTTIGANIENWDISNVTNISGMFYGASSFNQNISNWNVSNVTDMSYMFKGASSFSQDISSWNVSNVRDMSNMFNGAYSFNINISNWNVGNVTSMGAMFQTTNFNQPIGNWNTSKVIDMSYMFSGCPFNMNISNWNTSNVVDMKYMFYYSSFNQPIGNWNTSKVVIMKSMFSNGTFNQPIGNWNTSKVINMSNMFESSSFNQDIGNWNTSKVVDMSGMFLYATSFNQPIGNWNTSRVATMNSMFYYATSFNQNLSKWDISKATAIGLSYSKISNIRYDSILISWSSQLVKNGVMLSATGLHFCDAQVQRKYLITNKGWAISGDSILIGCILPINLTSFTAIPQQNKVLLQWQTATETNNNFFTVQRISNSDNWQDIATIKGAGNSSVAKKYSSTDNNPLQGISYYRIKQTDFNGSVSYSEVRSVDLGIRNWGISIYPNPASNELHINLDSKATIKIYNAVGKQMATHNLTQGDNSINIEQLSQGVYIAVIETANGVITKKIIKE